MNNISSTSSPGGAAPRCEEEISLYDIWTKLVQHKKLFWVIFCVVFAIGSIKIFLTEPEYKFWQVIEIGKIAGERIMSIEEAKIKIKKALLPMAVKNYNLQTKHKMQLEEGKFYFDKNDDGGAAVEGVLVLGISGLLANADFYKFIFQYLVDKLEDVDRVNAKIESIKKFQADLEDQLNLSRNNKSSFSLITDNKTPGMMGLVNISDRNYLFDNIYKLRTQLANTYSAHALSEVVVSDRFISPPRFVLLTLLFVVSSVFAFFCVIIVGFVRDNFKKMPA